MFVICGASLDSSWPIVPGGNNNIAASKVVPFSHSPGKQKRR